MMEALRILKAAGVKPRRTVRIGLWGGEEQGLLGSRAYVREHLADVETMTLKPEHAKISAYFNSDNGTGRVRGVWMQSNLAVRPIFEQWIAPLADLGVSILGPRSVSATDHVSFDDVGVPAFQFLVDRLEYNSRTHHSNMDTVDRVQRNDMIQQATVIAVFAYDAAMRDEKLPRKALPAPRSRSSQ
jgi:carboxypeptidase Q